MPAKLFSCTVEGISGKLIEVEADILPGLSAFSIVGLGDTSVQEAKERIRSAIKAGGFVYPTQKKVINLAPASLRKHGPGFDLPIALALLLANGQLPATVLEGRLCVGELALDGGIRGVRGVLAMVILAKEKGWKEIVLPAENYREACLVEGIVITPVANLVEAVGYLRGEVGKKNLVFERVAEGDDGEVNFGELGGAVVTEKAKKSFLWEKIQGQDMAKRALQVAAAGGHHLLMFGPPGSGKSMLAKALVEILPSPSEEEKMEITRIYSAADLLKSEMGLIVEKPFRQIHHSSSLAAVIGGGVPIQPGEITLAHRGVLFIDEIAEFSRTVLEALRQPLESREIHLARGNQKVIFPAAFTMIAAMNSCPCGNWGESERICLCTTRQIQNYQKKLSGPVFDRIDLAIAVKKPQIEGYKMLTEQVEFSNVDTVKESIEKAREMQFERYKGQTFPTMNAELSAENLGKFIKLDKLAEQYLRILESRMSINPRSYIHLLKTARTIADLKGQKLVSNIDLAEAWQYRISNPFEKNWA